MKAGNENENENSTNDNWVYLTTADNDFEYNIIKGKLNENNILCVGKGKDYDLLDSGFLNIVLGPCIPVDILVPSEMYDEAKGIMDLKVSDEELEKQAVNADEENNGPAKDEQNR